MNNLSRRSAGMMLSIMFLSSLTVVVGCSSIQRPPNEVNPDTMKQDLSKGMPIDDWIKKADKYNVGYSDDKDTQCLRTILRNVDVGLLTSKSIVYTVDYDKDRIITNCDIREVFTGP